MKAAIWEQPGELRIGDFPLDGFGDALATVRRGEGVKSQVLPGA